MPISPQLAVQISTTGSGPNFLLEKAGTSGYYNILGNTIVFAKQNLILITGLSREHECDRRTNGRIDHATVTSVAIAGIADIFTDAANKTFLHHFYFERNDDLTRNVFATV